MDSHNATQLVSLPTHNQGGTLDVVITSFTLSHLSSCVVEQVAFSDHFLVYWSTSFTPPSLPIYHNVERRDWRNFDPDEFRTALTSSVLNNPESYSQVSSADDLVNLYNSNLSCLLDRFAPVRHLTFRNRPRSSLLFDDECSLLANTFAGLSGSTGLLILTKMLTHGGFGKLLMMLFAASQPNIQTQT